MRWLILWTATAATALGQGGNFSGTAFDLDTGRTQVISGNVSDPNEAHRERMERYDRMNTELSASIDSMRQEYEMRNQTRELREQTELLRNMSKEGSGGSSSGYLPLSSVAAPSGYVARESEEARAATMQRMVEQDVEIQVLGLARRAKSFNGETKQPRERQLSAREGAEYGNLTSPNNEAFIKSLLQAYQGSFTDYVWRLAKVDPQTFIVTCSFSLDGKPYDLKFRVNLAVGTCRYEGGTALDKLAPAAAKRTVTFLDEHASSANERGEFDPDEYLMDKTWLEGTNVVFNTKTLKEGRDAGYSDDQIWSYLSAKDTRFANAKASGAALDELAGTQAKAEPTAPRIDQLAKAYGFARSQELSLELIKKQLPELAERVDLSFIAFNASAFGEGSKGVVLELEEKLGPKGWLKYMKETEDQLEELLAGKQLTRDEAASYLDEVERRSKGQISESIRATLLSASARFIREPAAEFAEGFRQTFRSKGHPKAKGADFSIALPASWGKREGYRPNIVQVFGSGNGNGRVMCNLLVKDLGVNAENLPPEEVRAYFEPSALKDLIPDGAPLLEAKSMALEGAPAGMVVFDQTEQRLDMSITVRMTQFLTVQKNRMIAIQFGIYSLPDSKESLDESQARNLPLFRAVANSFVYNDKYN